MFMVCVMHSMQTLVDRIRPFLQVWTTTLQNQKQLWQGSSPAGGTQARYA